MYTTHCLASQARRIVPPGESQSNRCSQHISSLLPRNLGAKWSLFDVAPNLNASEHMPEQTACVHIPVTYTPQSSQNFIFDFDLCLFVPG